jgi:hypothetical protein
MRPWAGSGARGAVEYIHSDAATVATMSATATARIATTIKWMARGTLGVDGIDWAILPVVRGAVAGRSSETSLDDTASPTLLAA